MGEYLQANPRPGIRQVILIHGVSSPTLTVLPQDPGIAGLILKSLEFIDADAKGTGHMTAENLETNCY